MEGFRLSFVATSTVSVPIVLSWMAAVIKHDVLPALRRLVLQHNGKAHYVSLFIPAHLHPDVVS
jgi:hypothetical protein